METEEMEQAAEESTQESAPGAEEQEGKEIAPEVEVEEQEAPEPPKGVQKRINDITREKYDAIRRAEAAEKELETERNKAQAPQPASTKKPTLEDFDHDDGAYLEALTDWKVDNALQDKAKKDAEKVEQQRNKERVDAIVDHATNTIGRGRTAYEDWDTAISPVVPLLNQFEMAESLMDVESPENVVYYLAKNPEEAEAIARMSSTKRAMALGKIELRLGQTPAKKVSDAPPPVKPVGGKASAAVDISNMSGDEYRAYKLQQRKK